MPSPGLPHLKRFRVSKPWGATRMARGGIRLIHGLTKSTLITYFLGMKIDPKYAFLYAFFLIYLSCPFQNLSIWPKTHPFFQFCMFCTPKWCTCLHCLVLKNNPTLECPPPGPNSWNRYQLVDCSRSHIYTLVMISVCALETSDQILCSLVLSTSIINSIFSCNRREN